MLYTLRIGLPSIGLYKTNTRHQSHLLIAAFFKDRRCMRSRVTPVPDCTELRLGRTLQDCATTTTNRGGRLTGGIHRSLPVSYWNVDLGGTTMMAQRQCLMAVCAFIQCVRFDPSFFYDSSGAIIIPRIPTSQVACPYLARK